jgi:hypothetical protein
VVELSTNAYVEICWYFPSSREQYRLAGTVEIVTESHTDEQLLEARQQAWTKMSTAGEAPHQLIRCTIHCTPPAATSRLSAYAQALSASVLQLNYNARYSNGNPVISKHDLQNLALPSTCECTLHVTHNKGEARIKLLCPARLCSDSPGRCICNII